MVPGVLLFLEEYARVRATREGMSGAPGAERRDSGGGLRRLRSTSADGLVRALRRAGRAPSLPFSLTRLPLHRSEDFVVIGLLLFVFAMAKVKKCEEDGIV